MEKGDWNYNMAEAPYSTDLEVSYSCGKRQIGFVARRHKWGWAEPDRVSLLERYAWRYLRVPAPRERPKGELLDALEVANPFEAAKLARQLSEAVPKKGLRMKKSEAVTKLQAVCGPTIVTACLVTMELMGMQWEKEE
jgi:hypothetical protein